MTKTWMIFIFVILSCSSLWAKSISDLKELKPITCEDGVELLTFSLNVPADNPLVPQDPLDLKYLAVGVTNGLNIRLEICSDFLSVTRLERMVTNLTGGHNLQVFEASQVVSVRGLKEALFGDFSLLDIRARDTQEQTGVLVTRTRDGGAVAVIRLDGPNSTVTAWQSRSPYFLFGWFVSGDAFAKKLCDFGLQEAVKVVTFDEVRFEFQTCTGFGGGNTTSFQVKELKVVDSSPQAPSAIKGKELIFQGEELKKKLTTKWSHHNDGDYFILKIPEYQVTYTMRIRQYSKCETAKPGDLPLCPGLSDEDSPVGCYSRVDRGFQYGPIRACSDYHFAF